MAVPRAPWEGGFQEFHMLQDAMSEAHIVLHGPPDFPPDAEILGVCAVSTENADQNKYGWMVTDFLHWKMLFHGVGDSSGQTWLSSLDISKFLADVDGVDMINDGTIDKVVGGHKKDIATLPRDNFGFATALLERLAVSARRAAAKKTALVVMIFAPITPEQDICVDLGEKRIFLTTERLRMTINTAVGDAQIPVILVTPSPFTGGWLCRPSFMSRPACPTNDKMMRIIAKSGGGSFADRFIRSFTERDTPMMTEAQRKKVQYNDPMPLRPTELQIDCLHRFQRQIHESLEHRLSVFARDHALILEPGASQDPSSFSDSWMEYGPRQGRPIGFWAKRWGPSRPNVNDTHRYEFLGEAFGGTRDSQLFHLKYLAAIELDTHPGDWGRQVGGTTRELLTGFAQRLMPSEDDAKRVFDTIEFRTSSMVLAQMVAKAFDLPLPDGAKCRYWHDKMEGVDDDYYKKLQWAFGEILGIFGQAAVLPSENRHEYKNVRFWRAARWLSAAIALRFEHGSRQDIENFVLKDVARLIAKIRDMQKTLLLEDQAVTRAGLNWIAALGLGGEVQGVTATTALPEAKEAQGPAVSNVVLDAQATPWPSAVGERTSSMKSPVASFAEGESSLSQGDMQHAVKDLLEDFGTQPAANNKHHGAQGLAATATPAHAAKFDVKADDKEFLVANAGARFQTAANTRFPPSATDRKFDGPLNDNNNNNKSLRLGPHPKPAVTAVAPLTANNSADSWRKTASAPVVANNGTGVWDKAAGTSAATDNSAWENTVVDSNADAWDKVVRAPALTNNGAWRKAVGTSATTNNSAREKTTADNNADAWDKVVRTHTVTNASAWEKAAGTPTATNTSAWDKIVSTSATNNNSAREKIAANNSADAWEMAAPAVADNGTQEKAASTPAATNNNAWKETTPDSNADAWGKTINTGSWDKAVSTPAVANNSGWEKTVGTSAATNNRAREKTATNNSTDAWEMAAPADSDNKTRDKAANNSADAWEMAAPADADNRTRDKAASTLPATNNDAWEKTTVDSNADAWDKVIRTPAVANTSAWGKTVNTDSWDKAVSTPAVAINPTDSWEKTVDTPIPPNREQEKQASESAVSPKMTPTPQPPVQQAMKRLADNMLAGMMNGALDSDAMYFARVLQKAAEIVEHERAEKASGSKNENPAAEKTPGSQAASNVNVTSSKVDEVAGIPAEKTTTLSPEVSGASHEVTAGHSRMASFGNRMESLTTQDPAGPRSPAAERAIGMESDGHSVGGGANPSTAQSTAAQETAATNPTAAPPGAQAQLAEDDFFARAGINW